MYEIMNNFTERVKLSIFLKSWRNPYRTLKIHEKYIYYIYINVIILYSSQILTNVV